MSKNSNLVNHGRALCRRSIRFSSSKILKPNNILSTSHINGPFIHNQKHDFSNGGGGAGTKEEFPGGRFNIPAPTGQGKRPSIRVGGGGISLGPEFEPELDGLPWEPSEIHPERPPPGFMNVDGFFDDDMQVDGKKYQHSLFVTPQFVTKWHVDKLEDVTPEHFSLATIHYPAISSVAFVEIVYSEIS